MKIIQEGDSFKIFIKDFELFNSNQIFYGSGYPKIRENHGHFKIQEKKVIKESKSTNIKILNSEESSAVIQIEIPQKFNRIMIKINAFELEQIFGGGEQYTHVNLKGEKFPIWVQEQGVGRGHDLISLASKIKGISGSWYSTYFPSPIFLSTMGYALIFETYSPLIVDLKKKISLFEIWDNQVKIIIMQGESIRELRQKIKSHFNLVHTLPDWIHGTIIASQGGTEILSKKVDLLTQNEVPLSAVWCQDWSGTNRTSFGRQVYWNWEYDNNSYKNLPQKIQELNTQDIKFLSYINPFLIEGSRLFNIAKEKNYFVKNSQGEIYKIYVTTFPAGLIDLTNKDAYNWYKEIIKNNMINIGTSGWMADFGEYLPINAVLFSKEDSIKYHNKYSVDWAKLNYEAIVESKKEDIIFFMRSGYLDSVSYCPVYWAGDQNVNWSKSDGIASIIPAGLSSGLGGVDFFHWDAGGYTSLLWMKRTPELFMRWIELSAFSLIMRTHEGNRPDRNIQFNSNKKIFKHFIWMSKVHYSLKNYLKYQIKESLEQKLPVMRPLSLNYPEDIRSYTQLYQYMLGRDLLIAPILSKKKNERQVYLPPDNWVYLWNHKKYSGSKYVKVKATIGYIPVFIKESSPYVDQIIFEIEQLREKLNIDTEIFC